jgi:drug/metabolite transporter (DMT)-like permease
MRRERLIGWLCAGLLLVIWVGFHLMSRLTASQALTPWDVAALRYGGSFVAVLPLLAWRGLPRIALARLPVLLVSAGFGFPLMAYAGYQLAPAAHGAVVMAAGLPVAVALLGLAFGQTRIGPQQALSLAVVVGGSLLLGAATSGVYAGAWRGDLLFLGGAVSWSVYTVLVQRWRLQALDVTLLVGLGAAPLYLPVWWLALPSAMAEAPWRVVLTQGLFHGLGASVIAMLLYTRAVAAIGPGPTTMVGAVVPALAALIAWPLLGEALPPLGLVAVLLVSAGMLLGVLRPTRSR